LARATVSFLGPRTVPADVRVAILIADPSRADDGEAVCRALRQAAPYARIHAQTIDPVREFAEGAGYRTHAVAAALRSDVVLYLATATDKANAALIALRERAGYTLRLSEPEYARAWFSPNRRRSLYVLGAFPGAFGSLALALKLGCSDPAAAHRMRDRLQQPSLIAV
jgi:hypothetical protein